MSIDSAPQPTRTLPTRLVVPWLTVLPLAVVLAYADGFWMVTLRGAVGAIERTQQPFDGWWRESTVVLPLYVLAVLGTLTLAKRWFGPALRTTRTVLMTALLVTNVVLVGWVVAMRGGRLRVTRRQADTGTPHAARQIDLIRLLLVIGLIASAHIHAAVIPEHLGEWPAAGGFFALLTVAEIAVAAALLAARPRRLALIAAVVVSVGPLLVWLYS